tara:strand:- start:217 stop:1683 length:1467 start_codon:yes stop_codon:yes gene_type:complete
MGKKKVGRKTKGSRKSLKGTVEGAARGKTSAQDGSSVAEDFTPEILKLSAELSRMKEQFNKLLPSDLAAAGSQTLARDVRGGAGTTPKTTPKVATTPTVSRAPFVVKGGPAKTITKKLSEMVQGNHDPSHLQDLFSHLSQVQSPSEITQNKIINAIVDNSPLEITDEELDSFLKQRIDPVEIFAQLSTSLQARILADDPKSNPKLQSVSRELLSKITSKLVKSATVEEFSKELMAEFERVNSRLMEVMSSHNYLASCIKVSEVNIAELNAQNLLLSEKIESLRSGSKIQSSQIARDKASSEKQQATALSAKDAEIASLKAELAAEKDGRATANSANELLRNEIKSLKATIEAQSSTDSRTSSANEELQAEIATLKAEIVTLKAKPKKKGVEKKDSATQKAAKAESTSKETQTDPTGRDILIANLHAENAKLRKNLETVRIAMNGAASAIIANAKDLFVAAGKTAVPDPSPKHVKTKVKKGDRSEDKEK